MENTRDFNSEAWLTAGNASLRFVDLPGMFGETLYRLPVMLRLSVRAPSQRPVTASRRRNSQPFWGASRRKAGPSASRGMGGNSRPC
jgi:hypothetical protein